VPVLRGLYGVVSVTLGEIIGAVNDGRTVYWASKLYRVVRAKSGTTFLICGPGNYSIGLTHADGTTLNGKEEDFFVD
jgi:hypothetical protein